MKKVICFVLSLFFIMSAFAGHILSYEEFKKSYPDYEIIEKRSPGEIRRAYNDYVQKCKSVIATLDQINLQIEEGNREMNNLNYQMKQYTQNILEIRNEINGLSREEGNENLIQQRSQDLKNMEEKRNRLSSQISSKEEELRNLQARKAKLLIQLQQ